MAISNEEAMRDLQEKKQRSVGDVGDLAGYWYGIFIGAAGAYMRSGVITLEQYNRLIDDEFATA